MCDFSKTATIIQLSDSELGSNIQLQLMSQDMNGMIRIVEKSEALCAAKDLCAPLLIPIQAQALVGTKYANYT